MKIDNIPRRRPFVVRSRLAVISAAASLVLASFACAGSDSTTPRNGDGVGGAAGDGRTSAADRCAAVARSIEEAGFGASVKVECDGAYANVVSDTYPAHPKMNGISGTNDQVPVPAPGYVSPIALLPVRAAKPTSIDAALGVAVNGVPIYDYSAQGNNDLAAYDPKLDTKLTGELDLCNGHAGRGDDYHYHAAPTCMIEAMPNKGPAAILGWGFDGYPIYGNTNPDGTPIEAGELDVCNAKEDPTFGARYHTTDAPPYILQCLVGEVDLAKAPRVPPLSKREGGGKPPGEKPRGGVADLAFVESPEGTRRMTYQYGGAAYAIQFAPSATTGCWDFEETSFTTGGKLVKATYCRTAQ